MAEPKTVVHFDLSTATDEPEETARQLGEEISDRLAWQYGFGSPYKATLFYDALIEELKRWLDGAEHACESY